MEAGSTLRGKVMRRIYVLYVMRVLSRPKTRLFGVSLAALVLFATVSIKDVFTNALSASSSLDGFLYYMLDALISTEALVRIVALIFGTLFILALRDACFYCAAASIGFVRRRRAH